MTKEEWFDLPKLKMFDKDFNEKQFDEEMALGLLNELQVNWCGRHCDNYRKNSCGCYFPEFKEQMILKIKDHFESKEDTLEFKNFKLHADSTLKSMSKDELISYIHMLHHNWNVSDEQLFNVIEINNKLQDELVAIKNPQPYKFKELKKGMWVWMVWFKEGAEKGKFAKILNTYTTPPYYYNDEDGEEHERVEFRIGDGSGTIDFDAWKFYPPTKAMEYQE